MGDQRTDEASFAFSSIRPLIHTSCASKKPGAWEDAGLSGGKGSLKGCWFMIP